jgi:hypothetical protein
MRKLGAMLLGLTLALCLLSFAEAGGEGKEAKLKGTITCAKCDYDAVKAADPKIEKPAKCETVIIAKKKGGKEVVIYFDKDSHKKYHGKICREPKQGMVTGTVTKKDGKNVISVTELNFKKD